MLDFGPWHPAIPQTERVARCRALRALTRVLAGPHGRDLAEALRQAETDDAALSLAADLLERLPALPRRHVLAAYGAMER